MNKRLIVLAVAGVLAAPLAAQAGVEIYGKARMSLDYINNDDTGLAPPAGSGLANPDKNAFSVSSNVSRIGFKGDEDLGSGLKLLWQIETQVDFDTGGFATGNRNTWLGLGGGYGTVLAGKNETPLRVVTQRIDIFSDTKGDYNSIIGNIAGKRVFDNRFNNTLIYTSPSMSGFQVSAGYTPSRGNDATSTDDLPRTELQGKRDAASVSGSFNNGPLYLAAAYETLGKYASNEDSAKAFRLGGSWAFPQGTTVGGVWEKADQGGANGDRNAWYLNAAHKMGDATLKAAIARADDRGNITDSGAAQYTLGAAYALSKATEVYALYTMTNNDKNGTYGLWSGTEAIAGYTDKSVSALSLGINHNFSSK